METFIDEVIFIDKGHIQKVESMVNIKEEYKEGLKDYYYEQKCKVR